MKPGVGTMSSEDNCGGTSGRSGVEVASKDQDEFGAWGWGSQEVDRVAGSTKRHGGRQGAWDLVLRTRGSQTGSESPVLS